MYGGASSRVRSLSGKSENFRVNIWKNKGLTLSPYLFSIVLDKNTRWGTIWCISSANNLMLVGDSLKEVNKRLNKRREVLDVLG